jgi:hypothetical protein
VVCALETRIRERFPEATRMFAEAERLAENRARRRARPAENTWDPGGRGRHAPLARWGRHRLRAEGTSSTIGEDHRTSARFRSL